MCKIVHVTRDWQDHNQSLGVCQVFENGKRLFRSEALERGWRNNQRGVSCIPQGQYKLVLEWSPRFKKNLWEIYGVPGRSECKFHAANFWRQLNGCIALGINRRYIDGDRYLDVTSSRTAMKRFHAAMGNDKKAILIVTDLKI